jgi:hypothetical protein
MVRRAGWPSLVLTVLGLSCLLVSLPGQVARGAALEDFAAPYLGVEPISGEVPLLVVLLGPDDPAEVAS